MTRKPSPATIRAFVRVRSLYVPLLSGDSTLNAQNQYSVPTELRDSSGDSRCLGRGY